MAQSEHLLFNELVQVLEELRNDKELEIEGALGLLQPKVFESGTSYEYFRDLLTLFSTQASRSTWSVIHPKEKLVDYYFPGEIRGRYTQNGVAHFIRKQKKLKLDLHAPGKYNVRISASTEVPVVFKSSNKKPIGVRLQHRWTFDYKGCWRYILSKTTSGPTKDKACENPPRFEIEFEVLPTVFSVYASASTERIAENFIVKLKDLLQTFNHRSEKESVVFHLVKKWTN